MLRNIILIFGLSGSGKTTLATALHKIYPDAIHLNADIIRKKYDDWDFSLEGRERQARRVLTLAKEHTDNVVICDFICPLQRFRDLFKGSYMIFMDTVSESRFKDTDAIFERPIESDIDVVIRDFKETDQLISMFEIYKQINKYIQKDHQIICSQKSPAPSPSSVTSEKLSL
jgi:energy-coupling factor transporter ATP-binding protein EcfA2